MTADELKEIRSRLGLTQRQLAERLGLSHRDTVRAWEAGKTPIGGPAALALRLVDRLSGEFARAGKAVLEGLWTGA
jgi:DNA-binding transcriptional regulator YiaG